MAFAFKVVSGTVIAYYTLKTIKRLEGGEDTLIGRAWDYINNSPK